MAYSILAPAQALFSPSPKIRGRCDGVEAQSVQATFRSDEYPGAADGS